MTAPPIPLVFHLPRDEDGPVLIEGKQSPWRLLYAPKGDVPALGAEWGVRGVYLLFGPGQKDPDNYWVRVGKSAPGTLRKRVPAHVKDKKIGDLWNRALLVCSTSGKGFNSAEVGYLEGALANRLDKADRAELHEGQRNQDDTLEPWELDAVDPVIELVLSVMRVLGYSPKAAAPSKAGAETPAPESAKLSLGDLLEAGLLEPGAQLVPVRKKFTQTATVNENGSLTIDGDDFPSPSAAAVHLVGTNENGWRFWTAPDETGELVKLSDLRDQLEKAGPAPEPAAEPAGGPTAAPGPLANLLQAGLLKPGDPLIGKHKNTTYRATVTLGGTVAQGSSIGSPSTIAKALVGYPVNGWHFWRLDDDGEQPTLDGLRSKL